MLELRVQLSDLTCKRETEREEFFTRGEDEERSPKTDAQRAESDSRRTEGVSLGRRKSGKNNKRAKEEEASNKKEGATHIAEAGAEGKGRNNSNQRLTEELRVCQFRITF